MSPLRRALPIAGFAAVLAIAVLTTEVDDAAAPIRIMAVDEVPGGCDRDGVDVTYESADDDILDVVVSDIDWPSCEADQLRVALTFGGSPASVVSGGLPLTTEASGSDLEIRSDTATATISVVVPAGFDGSGPESIDVSLSDGMSITDGLELPPPPG